MIVAIDAGNSRIKWGLHDGSRWATQGALATVDVTWLAEAAEDWPADAEVVVCNVAGDRVGEGIHTVLAARRLRVRHFRSTAACCGVSNRYDRPAQLGADRWAALVGARASVSGACVVVCAGTATTIDVLSADGEFRGGLILPGFDLMRAALANNTAQLPLAEGAYHPLPRNTADAIVSGCMNAQLGAIERMYAHVAGQPGAVCLLTGGAATRLLPGLHVPARLAENLILDGLLHFARATPPPGDRS